jgi:IS5 family transposase
VRKLFDVQLALGAVPIEKVELPTKTRDELPPTLAALQWIFITPEVNREVFAVLESIQSADKKSTGRPGMDLWQILVLGVVRLTLDCNNDRLHHTANFDSLVRQLPGQPAFDMTLEFSLTSLKENLPLLTEDHLAQINAIVARHGRQVLQKKHEETHQIKVDSYVLETNVHFPTDLNLAWDAARKIIDLSSRLTAQVGLPGWRKKAHWKSAIKTPMRICARACKGGGANKQDSLNNTPNGSPKAKAAPVLSLVAASSSPPINITSSIIIKS